MKFVVVLWIETNETSVLEEDAVRDQSMMTDYNKQGMIYHKENGKKAPKGGWKAYMGRVLSVHSSLKKARKNELEFIAREFAPSPNSVFTNKKRKFPPLDSASDSETENKSDKKPSNPKKPESTPERRKKSKSDCERSLINAFSESSDEDDDDDDEFGRLTRKELISKVKSLQKKNKLLKESGQVHVLKELPGMLIQAMSSKIVLTKMNEICHAKTKPMDRPLLPMTGKSKILGSHFNSSKFRDISKKDAAAPPSPLPKVSQAPSTSQSLLPMLQVSQGQSTSSQYLIPDDGGHIDASSSCNRARVSPPVSEYESVQAKCIVNPSVDGIVNPSVEGVNNTNSRDQLMTLLSSNALREVKRAKNFSKMAKTLLTVLFDRATLQKSSLTKKGTGDVLDVTKIRLITDYVVEEFPGASCAAVRNAITQKIKDEKAACKRKIHAEEKP